MFFYKLGSSSWVEKNAIWLLAGAQFYIGNVWDKILFFKYLLQTNFPNPSITGCYVPSSNII